MIRIYGASDDLVEIEGDRSDEIGCYDRKVRVSVGTPEAGVLVTMRYGSTGMGFATWTAEIGQMAEGVEIPWPVSITNAEKSGRPDPRSYSVTVEIGCPPGTPVKATKISAKRKGP
jgi:hypothetical protein